MLANPSRDAFYLEDCVCIRETEKAILVESPELDDETWFPKSVLHDDSEVCAEGDEGRMAIKQWYADKVGVR